MSPRTPSSWFLARFTHPPRIARAAGVAVLLALLATVGLVDAVSGLLVSVAIFYLVPILLGLAWYGTRTAIVLALSSVVLRIAGDFHANGNAALPAWSLWNAMTSFVMFCVVVWIMSNLLALARRLEERVSERSAALTRSLERRRLLEHELLDISSRERNAMGEELHDDVGQHLVATAFASQVLAQRLRQNGDALADDADTIVRLAEEGVKRTRRLARGLLLSTIAPEQLDEKLGELAAEVARSGPPCDFDVIGEPRVDDPGTAAQLYRIAQEALRNAVRHAEATRIRLQWLGDARSLCLIVEDDGRGIGGAEPRSGMGLPIMTHRAAFIGASLSIVPLPERGLKVVCHLPLRTEAAVA